MKSHSALLFIGALLGATGTGNAFFYPAARMATRIGGSALLFTNYWVMSELIKQGHIIDEQHNTRVNPAIYTVYHTYKNASLVCAVGLLMPQKISPQLIQTVKKYW